jgi:hypothetical protein
MLRITTHDTTGSLIFQLEGKLVGPWVQELEQCWRTTVADRHRSVIRVDLAGLMRVDDHGKELLTAMVVQGAELVATDCWMKAIVAEIARNPAVLRQRSQPLPDETEG